MSKPKETPNETEKPLASGKTDEPTSTEPKPEEQPKETEQPGGDKPKAAKEEAEPRAPTRAETHQRLHPNGGLPPRVVSFLLDAFDSKAKGVPVGVRSREVMTSKATYQCAVAADGQRVSVMVHPSPATRRSVEESHASHFEKQRLFAQQVKEYEAAINNHKTGKRLLSAPRLENIESQRDEAAKQAAHNQRQCARLVRSMNELPSSYSMVFEFDRWVGDEYTLQAFKEGKKLK